MTIKDRLLELVKALSIGQNKFETSCGMSRGAIYSLKSSLGSENLARIIAKYPQVNLYWLVAGKGSMFIEPQQPTIKEENTEDRRAINTLIEQLAKANDEVRELRAELQRRDRETYHSQRSISLNRDQQ